MYVYGVKNHKLLKTNPCTVIVPFNFWPMDSLTFCWPVWSGKTYWTGKLTTINLLVLTGSAALVLILLTFFAKTRCSYEGVNGTEHSPSVSVRCSEHLLKCGKFNVYNIWSPSTLKTRLRCMVSWRKWQHLEWKADWTIKIFYVFIYLFLVIYYFQTK